MPEITVSLGLQSSIITHINGGGVGQVFSGVCVRWFVCLFVCLFFQ